MPTPFTSSEIVTVNTSGITSLDALITGGERWASPVISYSFPTLNSAWSTDLATGYGSSVFGGGEPWSPFFSPISTSDQTYFVESLQQWENVADLQFNIINESSAEVGDIRIAYTHSDDPNAQAWTYLEPYNAAFNGDIWIEIESDSSAEEWLPGSYSFLTLLHEVGHTLGLEHPFESSAFPVALDTMSTTIMSYSAIAGNQDSLLTFYPTTPMPLDISAIQYLYGANKTYHSGDDAYLFDDLQTYHETIWDGGGESDRIIYSGKQDAIIDLRQGAGSYIGNAVYAVDAANTQNLIPNVWVADGVIIENAISGAGNDRLIGNGSNNMLSGGAGIDTAVFSGLRNNYSLDKSQEIYTVVDQTGVDGQNTVVDIERLVFSNTNLALDLVGHAGQVAKLLGSVFGAATIGNKEFVGIGLSLLDGGMSNEQLATVALDAVGAGSHDAIVTLLWHHLFGVDPTLAEKQPYITILDNEEMSAGALVLLAADTTINTTNIGLVGLMQTGIEFV